MLAIGANIFGLFYNLNPIVVAVICVGIVMALLFYRLKRIHDIAKRKKKWGLRILGSMISDTPLRLVCHKVG